MGTSKHPEEVTTAPVVTIDRDVAAATRKQAKEIVSRADVDNLRDDPEAKAAFLATFTAADEKRIMSKVDKRFILLTGLMFLIKQVLRGEAIPVYVGHWTNLLHRSMSTMQQTSRFCTLASHPTS